MGMIKKIVCGMGVLIFITGYMAMASPAEKSDNAYIIGHGDVLRIFTWKEPDLSVEAATVRLDGKITFPLVNDVQAAGLSTMMLKKVLEDRLAGYVESPIVTVILVHPVSQRYYVLGEVQRIGEYPIEKNLTVMQAFAVAGGFTEWAAKDEIRLIRRVDGKDQIYRINYKGFLKGKNLEGNVRIQADDTIIVP